MPNAGLGEAGAPGGRSGGPSRRGTYPSACSPATAVTPAYSTTRKRISTTSWRS
ncbi:unnamed protein product [Lepidochelys kempii]